MTIHWAGVYWYTSYKWYFNQ